MNDEFRASLMGGMWFFGSIVLGALFISAAAQGELTPAHVALAIVILGLIVAGTIYFLTMKSDTSKAKRQDMDSMLRDMSDDDIRALKRRLSDHDPDEESVLDYVSDDGELVMRS